MHKCDPIELEFFGKKYAIIYQYFKCLSYCGFYLSQIRKSFEPEDASERLLCYI